MDKILLEKLTAIIEEHNRNNKFFIDSIFVEYRNNGDVGKVRIDEIGDFLIGVKENNPA